MNVTTPAHAAGERGGGERGGGERGREVQHSLVIRLPRPVPAGVVRDLAGQPLWEEQLSVPASGDRARLLAGREARRALAPGSPRLRVTQLRYPDEAADLVLVADRTAVPYPALCGLAGALTSALTVMGAEHGIRDAGQYVRVAGQAAMTAPGGQSARQRPRVPWGMPSPAARAGRGTLVFAPQDVEGCARLDLIGAIALVLARYSDTGSARLSLIAAGHSRGFPPCDGDGDVVADLADLGERGTAGQFRMAIEKSWRPDGAHPADQELAAAGVIIAERDDGLLYLPCLSAPFPLTIVATVAGDRVASAECLFDREAVQEPMARQFVRHAGRAARQLASLRAGSPLSEVELLTAVEISHIYAAGSTPARDGAVPAAIHDELRRVAALHPERVAVGDGDRVLTYQELDRESGARARGLLGLGVLPGELVGLCMERTVDLVVTMLAVLKAGAAYVPLDPHNPAERLGYIAADAGLRVVVSDMESFPAPGQVRVVTAASLDGPEHEAIHPVDLDLLPSGDPDAPAYVIYTSGSTGRPKGVVIPHRNVCALIRAAGDFGLTERDVWTMFHASSFDFSVWEIWGCLLTGGRLVIVPYLVTRSPAEFRDLLARERVTVLSQTPSAFTNLLHADSQRTDSQRTDSQGTAELSLRLVVFGGEALDTRVLAPWFDRHPYSRCRLVNMYGITETTVHVTARTLTPADAGQGSRSVGRALPGWSVTVRDARGRLVPPGVAGEIYVGGTGVASHYLGRDDLTGQRFLDDPLAGRVYRSGDKGRLRADGSLDYLGRLDDQVKIRGYRIELGEIAAVLLDDPGVAAAHVTVATGVDDDPADRRIAAYVVLAAGSTPAAVRWRAARMLPDYMVPSSITVLAELPLTANGKLDAARLPVPDLAGLTEHADHGDRDDHSDHEGHAAGSGPPGGGAGSEEVLRGLLRVWRQVLQVPVGPDDSFFDIGGNSLLAVRLQAAARDEGLAFSIRQLYSARSAARLAALLYGADSGADGGVSRPAGQRAAR